jgi:3-isopropylmalate/(R)-2-methylmalate dehydratase small subunit
MNNSLNNGLLPIVISDELLKKLHGLIAMDPGTKVKIDLEKQTFTILPTGDSVRFNINPYKKECLLKGLDDIDFLLSMKSLITSYENNKSFVK